MQLFKPVKTPCIGVCSTGIGDQVCRGCKRFSHEVIDWNAYAHEQRLIIAQRLENFLTQVVQQKIAVVDEKKLLTQIKHQQFQFNAEQNPYCWVFDLLRAGASQIDNLSIYGLQLLPAWQNTSLTDIRDFIDQDFYLLSCAYYERYINPHFNLQLPDSQSP
ncbi:MAG: DUF1289 domain-containing protein [Pseudomonadota bacterium]